MSPLSPRKRVPPLVRALSAPAVAIVLLAGGWVAGGLITNDFTASMVLTVAWTGAVGLACLALFHRRREMWPALAAFVVTASVAGIYLGAETVIDDKVDEDVVVADAPARVERGAGRRPETPPSQPANVLLARGEFESLEHSTAGRAQVIEVRGRRRVLTLTNFETDNGPDLRVYLATAHADQGSAGQDPVDLGALKGNVGNQQYELPPGVDLRRLTKVIIWCRAFSAGFGSASLREA